MTDAPVTDTTTKRFDTRKPPITFYLDDDLITAAPKVPAQAMIDLVEKYDAFKSELDTRTKGGTAIDLALGMFRTVLYPDSLHTVEQRMKDPENPIDLLDVMNVFQWLLGEAYGMRPTVPSPSSQDSSADGGTSLTDGPPAEASTPEISTGPDSSTSSTTGSPED